MCVVRRVVVAEEGIFDFCFLHFSKSGGGDITHSSFRRGQLSTSRLLVRPDTSRVHVLGLRYPFVRDGELPCHGDAVRKVHVLNAMAGDKDAVHSALSGPPALTQDDATLYSIRTWSV